MLSQTVPSSKVVLDAYQLKQIQLTMGCNNSNFSLDLEKKIMLVASIMYQGGGGYLVEWCLNNKLPHTGTS